MLAAVLAAEVAAYIEAHSGEVDLIGHRLVVRNGYHDEREVTRAAMRPVGMSVSWNFRVRFRLLDGCGAWLDSDMQGGPVDELLNVGVECPALDQLQVEVGRTVQDRVQPGLTGDDGKSVTCTRSTSPRRPSAAPRCTRQGGAARRSARLPRRGRTTRGLATPIAGPVAAGGAVSVEAGRSTGLDYSSLAHNVGRKTFQTWINQQGSGLDVRAE
jgi:hypothetical protein